MSHNGKFLITADDQGNVFRLTPSLTSAPTTKLETESILDLAISANDNYVITGGKSKILRVWAINENDMEYNFDLGGCFNSLPSLPEQNQTITSVASSNVSQSPSDRLRGRQRPSLGPSQEAVGSSHVRVFAPCNLERVTRRRSTASSSVRQTRTSFSPPPKTRASACRVSFLLPRSIDIRTYDTLSVLKGHNAEIITASFHPTESSLLVSGDYGGNINFWSIQFRPPLPLT